MTTTDTTPQLPLPDGLTEQGVANLHDAAMSSADVWQPGREGLFLGVPEADYHKAPGVSNSMLKRIEPTPAHLLQYLDDQQGEDEDDSTADESMALLIGSVLHSALFTPEAPLPKIAEKPEGMTFTTREGRAWKAAMVAEGRRILTPAEYRTLKGCLASLCNHPWLSKAMEHSHNEVSGFLTLTTKQGSVLRKFRADCIPRGNFLLDLKTVQQFKASPDNWPKVMADRDYHCQAAWYLDTWNEFEFSTVQPTWWHPKETFIFCVVEKAPPYAVALYEVSEAALEAGRQTNWRRLQAFIHCTTTRNFPGYSPSPVVCDLPGWKRHQIAQAA